MKWQERILSNLLKALFSICIHYPLCQRRTLWNVISCFLHGCTLSNVISCCSNVKHEITFNRINLKVVVSILVVDSPGFVCFTDFDFFPVVCIIFVTLDSFLGDRYFVVTCYYISFHFEYFIDKSIGLDNRLFLYKSSPTTRWNNLNTIYIRQRAIYPSCIHAIHLNYQA